MTIDPTHLDLVRRLLAKALTDPTGTAAELRAMAARLNDAAARLEQQAAENADSHGGFGDKVTINVRGPDDRIKQAAETRR